MLIDLQFTENDVYEMLIEYHNPTTVKVSITSDCNNGSMFTDLTTNFQRLVRVDLTIDFFSEIGEVSLDEFAMDGSVFIGKIA